MKENFQLSKEEERLVLNQRAEKAFKTDKVLAKALVISLAEQWTKYSQATGDGLSYSTFCNEFELDDKVPENFLQRQVLYEGVKQVLASLDDITNELATYSSNQNKDR